MATGTQGGRRRSAAGAPTRAFRLPGVAEDLACRLDEM
jgi:hypothetical protein